MLTLIAQVILLIVLTWNHENENIFFMWSRMLFGSTFEFDGPLVILDEYVPRRLLLFLWWFLVEPIVQSVDGIEFHEVSIVIQMFLGCCDDLVHLAWIGKICEIITAGTMSWNQHVDLAEKVVGVGSPKEQFCQVMPFDIIFNGSIPNPNLSDEVGLWLFQLFIHVMNATTEVQHAISFHDDDKINI